MNFKGIQKQNDNLDVVADKKKVSIENLDKKGLFRELSDEEQASVSGGSTYFYPSFKFR